MLALAALVALAVTACGSLSAPPSSRSSSAALAGTPKQQYCVAVGDVLSDGPDSGADPVGYAQAQILPLRQLKIADAPLRALAAEITREKLFERLHDELPYQTTVETESWKDQPDGSARVEQTIYVTRDSHKKIVIGEGGRTIKAIGSAARKEIAEAHEAPVHLFLFVKVRANWLDDPERYRAMGLDFPKT